MQLKFKKICFLGTIFVYILSFFLESNFVFFQTLAKETNVPRVNIVAVLVDDKIYKGISSGLEWYTTNYVQQKLSDTKALVIPLNLENIHAYDIYRMMENIYFDGLKDVNSSLIGLIMFGDIPLPVVSQDGYVFPTVFPYVDFEEQKYVWDSKSEYFVPNNNPMGQAEIRHGLVNYGDDIDAYNDFFDKIKQYVKNPNKFIGDSLWYDDFIAQKKGFLNENFPYYRNRVMFAEDIGYQRYSPLMKKMFRGEQGENAVAIVSDLEDVTSLDFEGKDVIMQMSDQGVDSMHSTKLIQQEIDSSFVSDYNNLFSNASMSTMRENVFAGGRWIKESDNSDGEKSMVVDTDSSTSKLQLKDDVLLGNENLQGLIENLNDLMERVVDNKIKEKNLSMDIVVPLSYEEVTKKRINFKCTRLVSRFDNYYFGNNVRFIDDAEDLSIYRGTYRNLSSLDGVTYNSLVSGNNSIKSKYDNTDLTLKSIGGSYDIFSNQVEGNRGYELVNVEGDLDIYDENKTQAKKETDSKGIFGRLRRRKWPESCSDDSKNHQCEGLFEFAKRWRGGASSINLDSESVSNGRYELSGYSAKDSWRPIYSMGGFQSLLSGKDEGTFGTGWYDGLGVGPQWAANSFKAYIKYSSPTQREGWRKFRWALIGHGYEIFENHTPDVHMDFSDMNYWNLDNNLVKNFSLFTKDSEKIFSISKSKSSSILKCGGSKKYSYKVISSIVKHIATTEDQINGIDRYRYGENGTLGMYYNDIKTEYENIQNDMDEILSTFPELISAINSGNAYISGKIADLYSGGENLSLINNRLSQKQAELSNLQSLLATASESEIDAINQSIALLEEEIRSIMSTKSENENSIVSILNDVSSYIGIENSKLSDVYKLIMGLYVENLASVMEFIIYLEGGNPDSYYESGNSSSLVKIGFLPQRISNINSMVSQIRNGKQRIISYYNQVYSLIKQQQRNWNELAVKLHEESAGNIEEIDRVTSEMDQIFNIIDDGKTYDADGNEILDDDEESEESTGFVLTGGTARISMEEFENELSKVNLLFSNLVENDTVGPAIVSAAKSDLDFRRWLLKNSINYTSFSDVDWINQYAQWAKGPGYDSEGASRNHDLLLGVVETTPGMNILTPDRPIDSPRYVVMQSVAGNEMKFIYPDLFKVEVYSNSGKDKNGNNKLVLLTPSEIKNNLIKYLSGKVDEYNTIVEKECNNALSMNIYFQQLKKLNYSLATPDKTLHSCGRPFNYKEFVDALGGEKMLDVIAGTLYYQNLTNKNKLSTGNVADDIELVKKSFSLNDKRGQILNDYLVEGSEKSKNPIFEIPTYELSGYEVAFINSDGKDYIFPEYSSSDGDSDGALVDSLDLDNIGIQPTLQEKQIETECNIPTNGKLPLFKMDGSSPWLEGFKCWWKKTLEEPLKVKLTFDNSLGEMLAADSLKDFIRNSDLGQSFVDWGESWSKYSDSWDSLLDSGTGYDADLKITQMQVEAEKHNQDIVGGDGGLSNIMLSISKNVKVNNTNLLLSDSNPNSNLRIESAVDLGKITVEFIGTGDGCLKIDSHDLCGNSSFVTSFNPKTNPFSGFVYSSDHKAGKVALIIKLGISGKYIENVVKYTVSPGDLDHVDIKINDKKFVAGMLSPISVIGYDKYGNKVLWGLEKYDFTVSQGRFLKDGAYQSGFSTNDFRNLNFYYQAPSNAVEGSLATIEIKSHSNGNVVSTGSKNIINANPVIKMNGTVVLQKDSLEVDTSYTLTENESIYVGDKIDTNKLKRIEIAINDLNGNLIDVDSQILVTSQNGLVVIGQVSKQGTGDIVFSETSKAYMKDGYVSVYYYPTTVAGNDVISIDIPGLDARGINLSIKPSVPSKVQLGVENDYLELNSYTNLEMFVSDVWGNPVDMSLKIKWDPRSVYLTGLNNIYTGDDAVISIVNVKNGYAKTQMYGVGAGLTSVEAGSSRVSGFVPVADLEFKVDKSLLPESGLNIMYLNYFGNDWGNQWGYLSQNSKKVESLMKKSNKIITTTTLLASESKIKKVLWKIDPGFKITNIDNVDTSLTMKDGNLNILIGGISKLQAKIPSFEWVTATASSIDTILNNSRASSKNYVFFISNESDYSIKDGKLYNSGNFVANILDGGLTLQLSEDSLDNGDNVWNIFDKGINYGKFVIHFPTLVPSVSNFKDVGNRYFVGSLFSKGSTDMMTSIGIFDSFSEFELDSNYKSIQDSDQIDESIGFLGDFKNITLFAEGEIVGEATKKYGSELLINLGDPVLSRKDVNDNVYGTNYDGGVGQEIFTDPENDIFGVYQIDFNNDGLKDWLIVYLDGGFKLLKNYGGKPDLRDMQELMRIAVHVKNVFVGDADGNGYDDIYVLTDNNQIRVYLNKGGKFDVDGNVACLNQNVIDGQISGSPSNLDGLNQFFVEDMDLDGAADIITYDAKGYIKVFYGGSSSLGLNYLSTDKYACDTGWYNREIKNTKVVTALGVQVFGENIYDNSMMHWVGMDKNEIEISESDLSGYGIKFNPNTLESLIKQRERNSDGSIDKITREIMDKDKFDVSTASSKFIDQEAKFVEVTLYENTLVGGGESKNYIFSPISFLDPDNPDDKCSVWKNYYVKKGGDILMDGDVVSVRVTVKASNKASCVGAYGDIIQGPWNVYYDENSIIKGFRFLQNQRNAVLKSKDGNFSYIVDNITLSKGERMVFEYDLEYHQLPLKKMDITHETFWSSDNLPDIKLQSVDGCVKDFDGFINSGGRSFEKKVIPLQEYIDKEYQEEDEMTEDYAEDIISYGSDVNQLPGIVENKIERVKLLRGNGSIEVSDDEDGRSSLKNALLQSIFDGGDFDMNLNINLSVLEEQTDALESIVDDITKGMCNGFSFGGSNNCKGLPVPFNQAFLAPGKYHLFGCWELPLGPLEGGLPIFFFPGTLPTPFGPIPIPWGLKSATDEFLRPGGGTYPSFIRIYAAPTLTAQLGIAICMSPEAIWSKIPSPISDIAGNCVVFAIKPQCKKGDNGGKKKDNNNPNPVYDSFIDEVKDSGVCLQSQKGPQVTEKGHSSSPFMLYDYKAIYNGGDSYANPIIKFSDWLDKNVDVNGGSYGEQADFDMNSLGIINLEIASYVGLDEDNESKNSIFIGDIDVLGGEFSINKIRGGIQQGIRKILIDKWLDPQIRYILNQLTKMHINIKLPDPSKMIDYEIETLKNVGEKMSKDENDGEDAGSNEKLILTGWSSINYDNLNKLNKSIANPFESLASLLNQSNIINISVEPITVKVPMIFAEDINAYELYLQQWLETNESIAQRWKSVLSDSDLIRFEGDWQKIQNQLYANLVVLQKYRNFPFEIYEWVHAIDTYISEITSLVNSTIGYLSYWTSTNSQRFVGYVDAIVLMLNIIKTYQLLINFSVEWGQNCGSCSKDTYDQYSCKLSLLCDMIQLPIIQIPNFKLPNITIDLTDIDLGLDIILPDFNFQPVSVNLPDLPNLPEPPDIGVNIDLTLPDIPVLPEPPELPELPSFIPEIDIELPILPPAPELPKLPNEIEATIKAAKLIGKIYCIVKGKFGLVGETSVKAKIEQLTQRTYEVKWIDTIMDFTNLSVAPVHNYGLDYEISSHVDLQFDFSVFYNYLDTLTKSINNLSTSSVNWLNKETDSLVNYNPLIGVRDSIDGASIGADIDLNLGLNSTSSDIDLGGLKSDDIEYVDYSSAKSRLENVLTYFKEETMNTTMGESVNSAISSMQNQINKTIVVSPNVKGMEKLKDEVVSYLDKEKLNYDDLADLINNDYNKFLVMVDSQNSGFNSSSDTGKLLTFNVQLFDIDSSTNDVIKNIVGTNPFDTILSNKKSIIDGYWNAINSNTANDLGLTQSQYLVLRNNIGSMRDQVTTLYSVAKPVSSTELIAKNSRVTSNKSLVSSTESSRLGSNIQVADVVDPSVLSEGIYDSIITGADKGKISKVVYSDSFTTSIGDRYYKTSNDKNHDILMFEDGGVYLKCLGGECPQGYGGDKKYYHSKSVLNEIPFVESWLEFDSKTKLKIGDNNLEVKNWKVSGQSYDLLHFSWTLDDADAYLIKLVERVDYSYEKVDHTISTPVRYVLAVPEGTNLDELYSGNVKLELLNGVKRISDIYGKDLVQIVTYDNYLDFADITLSNIERKWYYSRIATLNIKDDIYSITSPWSNQIVAGKQIVGDDQSPVGNPSLYRPSVNKVVSEGNNLEGFVGTKYKLQVDWEDNAALYYINISKDGKILNEKYTSSSGDSISTNIGIHTKSDSEIFISEGIDQFGNKTKKQIVVNYSIPEIEITDISRNSDGSSVAIKAELSQDIDQGSVSFQRRRGNVWKTMKRKDLDFADFSIGPGQRIILGSPFSAGNDIALYDKNDNVIALMDPDTAEIKLQSGFTDLYEVNAVVQDNLVLQIRSKNTHNLVFSIYIPTQECKKIEADGYNITNLPIVGRMGVFNGGKVVHKDGNNLLFISSNCDLYSEGGLEGNYSYDREQDAVMLELYEFSDISRLASPIKVFLKVKPFLES